VASERRLASFQSFEQRWSPFELSAEPTLSLVSFLELAGPSRLLGASEQARFFPTLDSVAGRWSSLHPS
jgi:hypothetical protein